MLLEGIFLPLPTPFHPDGRLFTRKLEANVARYSLTPAAGMVIGSLEGQSLTDSETREMFRVAIAHAAEEKVMIAAVGRESVAVTLSLVEEGAAAGYDAVLVQAPALDSDQRLELLTYLRMIADGSTLPVILAGMPAGFSAETSAEVISEMAQHPRVFGYLGSDAAAVLHATQSNGSTNPTSREVTVTSVFAAATGRMLRRGSGLLAAASLSGGATVNMGAASIKTRQKRVGFQVLTNSTANMLEAWRAGASGAVPRFAPCAPQACCEVWQAFKDDDPLLAEEKQQRLLEAARWMEGPRGVAAIKYGCDLNGYYGGRPRLPLLPLDGSARLELQRVMAGLKT